jgi:hypothetical protein
MKCYECDGLGFVELLEINSDNHEARMAGEFNNVCNEDQLVDIVYTSRWFDLNEKASDITSHYTPCPYCYGFGKDQCRPKMRAGV